MNTGKRGTFDLGFNIERGIESAGAYPSPSLPLPPQSAAATRTLRRSLILAAI